MKGILITVRSASTRLNNKCYKKIKDRHTIEYVIEQAKKSTKAQVVVLCTTELPEDDLLCEIASNNGIQYFRGSVTDKLERWNGACKSLSPRQRKSRSEQPKQARRTASAVRPKAAIRVPEIPHPACGLERSERRQ